MSSSTLLDLHKAGTAVPEKAKDPTIDMSNGDLLSPLDTDKRFSSIRLRNYKSIGNLDQQAREDGLFGSNQNAGNQPFNGIGGMTVSQSMPLVTSHHVQNEEMEGKLLYCSTRSGTYKRLTRYLDCDQLSPETLPLFTSAPLPLLYRGFPGPRIVKRSWCGSKVSQSTISGERIAWLTSFLYCQFRAVSKQWSRRIKKWRIYMKDLSIGKEL